MARHRGSQFVPISRLSSICAFFSPYNSQEELIKGLVLNGYMCFSLLILTLISDLRNQGQFQTLEKFQVLQTLFFSGSPPWKELGLHYKSEKNLAQIKSLYIRVKWKYCVKIIMDCCCFVVEGQ